MTGRDDVSYSKAAPHLTPRRSKSARNSSCDTCQPNFFHMKIVERSKAASNIKIKSSKKFWRWKKLQFPSFRKKTVYFFYTSLTMINDDTDKQKIFKREKH